MGLWPLSFGSARGSVRLFFQCSVRCKVRFGNFFVFGSVFYRPKTDHPPSASTPTLLPNQKIPRLLWTFRMVTGPDKDAAITSFVSGPLTLRLLPNRLLPTRKLPNSLLPPAYYPSLLPNLPGPLTPSLLPNRRLLPNSPSDSSLRLLPNQKIPRLLWTFRMVTGPDKDAAITSFVSGPLTFP